MAIKRLAFVVIKIYTICIETEIAEEIAMMSPLFFVLENTQIHSYFANSDTITLSSEKVKVSEEKIEIDSGIYPVFGSVEAAMESIAEHLKGKYVFVDDNGVIHNVDKEGRSSTYLPESGRMKIRFEDVVDAGFPGYKSVSFVDPEGIIEDQGDHVAWEPEELAGQLDWAYSERD